MFEYQDNKLGKVKVINVTEARASIAGMMADKESNYVITKNNKPIRVVVNYDYLQQLQAQKGLIATSPSSKPQKPLETKDPVKGLLRTKTEDLKRQVAGMSNSYFHNEAPIPAEAKAPESETVSAELPETLPHTPDVPMDELPETGDAIIEEAAVPAEWEEISEVPVTEEPAVDVQDIVEPVAEEEVLLDDLESRTDPDRGDYFDRFRKLYEAPRHDRLFQGEGSVAPTRTGQPDLAPALPVEKTNHSPAPTHARGSASVVSAPPVTEHKSPSNLPSIQDLLSEIEGISLSGEEEEKLAVGMKG